MDRALSGGAEGGPALARPEDLSTWYARMRELYKKSPMHPHLGLTMEQVEDGAVVVALAMLPELNNAMGMIHGAVLTAAIDSALLQSVRTRCDEGDHLVTVELKVNFLKPAIGPRFLCRAQILRVGGSVGVAEAKVTGPDSEIVAGGMGTIFIKRKKDLLTAKAMAGQGTP